MMAQYMSFGYFVYAQTPCLRYKLAHANSENKIQPAHPLSMIRVFAVRMKNHWDLGYPKSAWRRLRSACADAQADRSLRWAHISLCLGSNAHTDESNVVRGSLHFGLSHHLHSYFVYASSEGSGESPEPLLLDKAILTKISYMLASMAMLNVIGDTFHPHTTVVRTRGVINLPLNHGGGDMDPTMSLF